MGERGAHRRLVRPVDSVGFRLFADEYAVHYLNAPAYGTCICIDLHTDAPRFGRVGCVVGNARHVQYFVVRRVYDAVGFGALALQSWGTKYPLAIYEDLLGSALGNLSGSLRHFVL